MTICLSVPVCIEQGIRQSSGSVYTYASITVEVLQETNCADWATNDATSDSTRRRWPVQ